MGRWMERVKTPEVPGGHTLERVKTPSGGASEPFEGTPSGTSEKKRTPEPPLPTTREWFLAQGCNVLLEDLHFIRARLPRGTRRRNAVLLAYVDTWADAASREPLEHRKEGRGRFAANTALLEGRLPCQ